MVAELLQRMFALCPDSMIGRRDRALLALGFAGAFRRSELIALRVEDLAEVPDGLRVPIRRSKGDQERQVQEVAFPRAIACALQTWLRRPRSATGRRSGPSPAVGRSAMQLSRLTALPVS